MLLFGGIPNIYLIKCPGYIPTLIIYICTLSYPSMYKSAYNENVTRRNEREYTSCLKRVWKGELWFGRNACFKSGDQTWLTITRIKTHVKRNRGDVNSQSQVIRLRRTPRGTTGVQICGAGEASNPRLAIPYTVHSSGRFSFT